MIPHITDSLIHEVIQTQNMVLAGQSYWRQGRVSNLAIDAEMDMITADVRGSARHPYEVMIIFNEDDAGEIFEVDCSCPVGFGCKHCAAVLYAARSELVADLQISSPVPVAKRKSAPPPKAAPLPQPLFFWLAEAQAHGPSIEASAPDIAYTLTPRTVHAVKKVKGRPTPIAAAAMPYEMSANVWFKQPSPDGRRAWSKLNRYDRSWTDQVPTPLDAWLIKRIHDYHGDLSGGNLKGLGGTNWLDQAIATGNVRWRKMDGPVLHMREGREAEFRWVTVGAGEQRLTLADVPAGMTLIALAPPLLIDNESGAVHGVVTGVEGTLAERLLHLPPVPPHAVQALAEQWRRVTGNAVPPPTLHNLIDRGMITPTPVLTFREEGVDVFLPQRSHYYSAGTMKARMATARLSFDYEGSPVTHATDATLILNVTDEGTIQFQRDLAVEEKAFTQMARLGLKPIRTFHEAKAKGSQAWDLAIQIGAVPADYADILQNHVPRLREEGMPWDARLPPTTPRPGAQAPIGATWTVIVTCVVQREFWSDPVWVRVIGNRGARTVDARLAAGESRAVVVRFDEIGDPETWEATDAIRVIVTGSTIVHDAIDVTSEPTAAQACMVDGEPSAHYRVAVTRE